MKIFNTKELQTREELKKLSFYVSESSDMFDDEDELDHDFFIEFYEEDGCLYDDDELWYHFQDEFENIQGELYNPVEGVFTYDGLLTMDELIEYFKKIGFSRN
jgi:hypothetical protein